MDVETDLQVNTLRYVFVAVFACRFCVFRIVAFRPKDTSFLCTIK